MTYKGNFAALTGTEREALEALVRVGQKLSNVAFNLSQATGHALEERQTNSLRAGYKEWDEAQQAFSKIMDKSRKRLGQTEGYANVIRSGRAKIDAVGTKGCKATVETR